MKNIFLPGFIALSFLNFACESDKYHHNNTSIITVDELPKPADELITKYFPDADYRLIKKHQIAKFDGTVYDVILTNNFEIDFDSSGKMIDIDGNHQPIPQELIPEKIINYVSKNYPKTFITSFDDERLYIEVDLSNNLELIFDPHCNFVRIEK